MRRRAPVVPSQSNPKRGVRISTEHIIKIADRLPNENRSSIVRSKSLIDFCTEIGARFFVPSVVGALKRVFFRSSFGKWTSRIDLKSKFAHRFPDQNRIAIFPERFFFAILIAIAVCKSGSGCKDVLLFWKIAHEPIGFTRTMENGQKMMGITRSGTQAPVLFGGSTPFGGMNRRFSRCSEGCCHQQQKNLPGEYPGKGETGITGYSRRDLPPTPSGRSALFKAL